MSIRQRGPNESQMWYCKNCKKETVHVCFQPKKDETAYGDGRGMCGNITKGEIERCYYLVRCKECYYEYDFEDHDNWFQTVELRSGEYERLIRRSEQLDSLFELLKQFGGTLNRLGWAFTADSGREEKWLKRLEKLIKPAKANAPKHVGKSG